MQLIGEGLEEKENELEKKSIEKFLLLKQTEQERRLRAAELTRQTMLNQINEEIKTKYESYDEMIRLKR